MLFPTLGPSRIPVVVAQPDKRHAYRCLLSGWVTISFCVGVVSQSQSIQHLVQTKKPA